MGEGSLIFALVDVAVAQLSADQCSHYKNNSSSSISSSDPL
jgi:hypothetical protein